MPILLDSPEWNPTFNAETVEVRILFDEIGIVKNATFDGVTAGLRVNQSAHTPLLSIVDVMNIVSGDLSLTGKVDK